MSPPEPEEQDLKAAKLQAWCLILFFWGLVWLNYPWLQLFNSSTLILGLPLLVCYQFSLWLLLIVILYLLMRRLRRYF